MKIFYALILMVGLAANATAGPYYGIRLSTPTGIADLNLSGEFCVAPSSTTPFDCKVTINGQTGNIESSGTIDGFDVSQQFQDIAVSTSAAGNQAIQDEGIDLPLISTINFVGPGVIVSESGGIATVTISTQATAAPVGSAGGDLTGTYPDPTIAAGAVTSTKIGDAEVTTAKLASGAVGTDNIQDNSIPASKVDFNFAGSSSEGGAATTALVLDSDPSDAGSGFVARGIQADGTVELALVDALAVDASTNPVQSDALFDHAALNGSSAHSATSANTASQIVTRDGSGNFSAGTITASLTGNAATATALVADPSDAASGFIARGIQADGTVELAIVDALAINASTNPIQSDALFDHAALNGSSAHSATSANTASQIVTRDGSGNFSAGTITAALTGNADTATTLAADGSNAGSGRLCLGIDASGNCQDATVDATEISGSTNPVQSGGLFTHDANSSAHHTATVNTDAESKCVGSESLRGDGNCTTPIGGATGHTIATGTITGDPFLFTQRSTLTFDSAFFSLSDSSSRDETFISLTTIIIETWVRFSSRAFTASISESFVLTAGESYELIWDTTKNTAGRVFFRFNNDAGTNYEYSFHGANPGVSLLDNTSGGDGEFFPVNEPTLTADAGYHSGTMRIHYMNNDTKRVTVGGSAQMTGSSSEDMMGSFHASYDGAAAVTSVQIFAQTGTIDGTVKILKLTEINVNP